MKLQKSKHLEPTEKKIDGHAIYRKQVESEQRKTRPVVIIDCPECGKETTVEKGSYQRYENNFCSPKCASNFGHKSINHKAENNPNYKEGKKKYVKRLKLEAECECGEARDSALCFHHKDPENKIAPVSRMAVLKEYSLKDIKEEVGKCEIICINCHILKHREKESEQVFTDDVPTHEPDYKSYKQTEKEWRGKIVWKKKDTYRKCIIRECNYCGQEYFAKISQLKLGDGIYHSTQCSSRASYESRAKSDRCQTKKGLVDKLKEEGSCVECGEERKLCLQFHHKKPDKKNYNIGELVRNGGTMQELRAELKKCELRCGNCHQSVHTN